MYAHDKEIDVVMDCYDCTCSLQETRGYYGLLSTHCKGREVFRYGCMLIIRQKVWMYLNFEREGR